MDFRKFDGRLTSVLPLAGSMLCCWFDGCALLLFFSYDSDLTVPKFTISTIHKPRVSILTRYGCCGLYAYPITYRTAGGLRKMATSQHAPSPLPPQPQLQQEWRRRWRAYKEKAAPVVVAEAAGTEEAIKRTPRVVKRCRFCEEQSLLRSRNRQKN